MGTVSLREKWLISSTIHVAGHLNYPEARPRKPECISSKPTAQLRIFEFVQLEQSLAGGPYRVHSIRRTIEYLMVYNSLKIWQRIVLELGFLRYSLARPHQQRSSSQHLQKRVFPTSLGPIRREFWNFTRVLR